MPDFLPAMKGVQIIVLQQQGQALLDGLRGGICGIISCGFHCVYPPVMLASRHPGVAESFLTCQTPGCGDGFLCGFERLPSAEAAFYTVLRVCHLPEPSIFTEFCHRMSAFCEMGHIDGISRCHYLCNVIPYSPGPQVHFRFPFSLRPPPYRSYPLCQP